MVGRSLGNKSDHSDSRSTSYSDEGEARDRYTTEDAYSDDYVSLAASLRAYEYLGTWITFDVEFTPQSDSGGDCCVLNICYVGLYDEHYAEEVQRLRGKIQHQATREEAVSE